MYNVNINQKAIIDNKLPINIVDCAIFDFMYNFIASENADKFIKEDKIYYWISYQYVIDSMPILKIKSKDVISRHIQNLIDCYLIDKIIVKEFGNKTFYCLGKNAKCLFFDSAKKDLFESDDTNIEKSKKTKYQLLPDNIKITVDTIYNLYPAKCPYSLRSTQKSSVCKDKISLLVQSKDKEDIEKKINTYLAECAISKTYLKNFETLLNNLYKIEIGEGKDDLGFSKFVS